MKNYNYKRRNLVSGPHLLGTLLIIAGLLALVSPLLFENKHSLERVIGVGVGAAILGLAIVSSYGGTRIDFAGNRFRNYFSIGGYEVGEWKILPAIVTVKVVSATYMSTNTPNGISPTLSGKVTDYRTLIYSEASRPEFSFVYSKKSKAVKHAKVLASNLNAEMVLHIPGGEKTENY